MLRVALLVAGAYANSNYTTVVFTAKGAIPNYDTRFVESTYLAEGHLEAEVSHHEFEEPDEFTLWLGPQGTATAEALLNKTEDCDFRFHLENALETQGMLAQVSLTHACITVELGVGCDEVHALPVACPTNLTTTGHTDVGAGAIIAIVFGVMIVFVVLCVCCWGYCRSREEQFVDSERYTRERSFSFEMPPVAEYGKK